MNVYNPRNFSVLLGGSVAEWFGRWIWNLEIPSSGPALTAEIPDWIRDSSPRLRLYKANWSASCQLGFLTC